MVQASDFVEVGVVVDAGQGFEHHRQQSMKSGRRQPIGAASDVVVVWWRYNGERIIQWVEAHRVREDFEP